MTVVWPRHRVGLRVAGAFAVSLMLIGCLWLPGALASYRRDSALIEVLRHATAQSESGIKVSHGSAVEIPSGRPDVRIYLVQTDSFSAGVRKQPRP